jgi:hypothetical protein
VTRPQFDQAEVQRRAHEASLRVPMPGWLAKAFGSLPASPEPLPAPAPPMVPTHEAQARLVEKIASTGRSRHVQVDQIVELEGRVELRSRGYLVAMLPSDAYRAICAEASTPERP